MLTWHTTIHFSLHYNHSIIIVLSQVEREKIKTEEVATKSVMKSSELDKNLIRMEEENLDLNKSLQITQAQLSEAEQQHAQRYKLKYSFILSQKHGTEYKELWT